MPQYVYHLGDKTQIYPLESKDESFGGHLSRRLILSPCLSSILLEQILRSNLLGLPPHTHIMLSIQSNDRTIKVGKSCSAFSEMEGLLLFRFLQEAIASMIKISPSTPFAAAAAAMTSIGRGQKVSSGRVTPIGKRRDPERYFLHLPLLSPSKSTWGVAGLVGSGVAEH